MALIVVTKTEKIAGRIRVQVIESYREGQKVKQKLVRNIGTAHSQEELEIFFESWKCY